MEIPKKSSFKFARKIEPSFSLFRLTVQSERLKADKMIKFICLLYFGCVLVSCIDASYRKTDKTVNDALCLTECVLYTVYRSVANFCYYARNMKDYCEPESTSPDANQYLTATKSDANKRYCYSECTKAGYDYYWCYTSKNNSDWDYCSPSDGVSYKQEKCLSDCKKDFYSGAYKCKVYYPTFVSEFSLDYCSPRPYHPPTALQKIKTSNANMKKAIKNHNQCVALSEASSSNNGGDTSRSELKRKRQLPNSSNFDVREIVDRLETELPLQYISEAGRAPVQFTSLMMPDGVELLLTMHALLRPHTTPPRGSRRLPYPSGYEGRMTELHQLQADDVGHVLALSLGGPATSLINLIPQHQMTNRNAGRTSEQFSFWRNIENTLQRTLFNSTVESVQWMVHVMYGNDIETEADRRPTNFGMFYTIFYNDGSAPYESGDCLFANHPGGGGDPI